MSVPELRRFVHRQNRRVLELFPDTARIDGGSLSIGGITAADLVREHGSPLVVYDEATLRARARAYREAAPHAAVVYGTKAFPNIALMRILAEEGIGADVSTLGELRFAQAAGITGGDLVVHGNNKSQEELEAAADAGALVVVDSLEEIDRAREARVSRTLIRVTPGIEADTHEAIRTGHHGSKFGLTPTTRSRRFVATPRPRVSTCTSAPSFVTSPPPARPSTGSRRSRLARTTSSAGRCER